MRMTPTTRLGLLADLLIEWGHSDADLVIAGDGSGTTWASPCGWGAVLVDRAAGGRRRRAVFYAGMNLGTAALAELWPYLHALSWHQANWGDGLLERLGRPIKTLILSDCKTLTDTGNTLARRERALDTVRANRPTWAALTAFEGLGYELRFRWEPRLSTALNCYCDDLAGRCRRYVEVGAGPHTITPPTLAGHEIRACDCNPDRGAAHRDLETLRPPPRRRRSRL
jgi:hypothetical protein